MKRIFKNKIIICILIVIFTDVVIGCILFTSRSFSHLAIWNIIESNKQNDFYWQPENAPRYFWFEPYSGKTPIFRNEVYPLIKNESDELKRAIKVAKYIKDIEASSSTFQATPLKWDSPEGMLRQIRKGANANCFHRSILFSTYLSSLGLKSRLWALENEKFNAPVHTVTEVYIKSFRKWVFMDITLGFYITEDSNALSLLELRERLLDGNTDKILVHNIHDEIGEQKEIPAFYRKLIKCVFLRVRNDFVNRYNTRYGVFSIFHKYIDKSNDNFRRGVEYLFGPQDIFIHYVDKYSQSLKPEIIIVKLLFYFLILSIVLIGVLLVTLTSVFLRRCLLTNLSKKDTLHR